jgi:hypothetical protein
LCDYLRMSELQDTVSDVIDKTAEGRLHSRIAVLVAVAATFMALCNVKDGNICQAMAQDQAKAVDAWAYYQAKGTKLNLAEAMLDQMRLQREVAAGPTAAEARSLIDAKIAGYVEQVKKYEVEKNEIKAEAEGLARDYDRLNVRDDQFDMAEALISISLALFGITALTKKTAMFWVSGSFALLGTVLGLAGFIGWNMHPDFLARLLG